MKWVAWFLGFLLSGSAFADVPVPQWASYAAPGYLVPEQAPGATHWTRKQKVLVGLTSIYPPVPILLIIQHKNRNDAKEERKAYWTSRKQAFDNEVATCQSGNGDLAACFMQVHSIETNKTANRRSELLQAQQVALQQRTLYASRAAANNTTRW